MFRPSTLFGHGTASALPLLGRPPSRGARDNGAEKGGRHRSWAGLHSSGIQYCSCTVIGTSRATIVLVPVHGMLRARTGAWDATSIYIIRYTHTVFGGACAYSALPTSMDCSTIGLSGTRKRDRTMITEAPKSLHGATTGEQFDLITPPATQVCATTQLTSARARC